MYQEIIISLVFLAGLIFCITGKKKKEGFLPKVKEKHCPNLLIKRGNAIFLYNKKRANIPGVNPIRFNNLDEYVEFMKWQRHVGIRCPVLYLQETYDAQNNLGLRVLDNPVYPNAGMLNGLPSSQTIRETLLYDANRLDPPYNQGDYPGYDSMNQYIGDYTPLDKMFHQSGVSPNPMDPNYVPQNYVDNGYYLRKNGIQHYKNQNNYKFDNFNQNDASRRNSNKPSETMSEYTHQQKERTEYIDRMQKKKQQEGFSHPQGPINPQYSSMWQYAQPRSNPPDAPIEGKQLSN